MVDLGKRGGAIKPAIQEIRIETAEQRLNFVLGSFHEIIYSVRCIKCLIDAYRHGASDTCVPEFLHIMMETTDDCVGYIEKGIEDAAKWGEFPELLDDLRGPS